MSTAVRPRTKDHFSLKLRIKRPGATSRAVLIGLAVVQGLLLYTTASSMGQSGALYGCTTPCGSLAQPVATPFFAVLVSVAMFVLPAVIGALSRAWHEAVAFAALPWLLAVVISARTLLAPTASVIPATKVQPAASHFSAPFWSDTNQLMPLVLALVLFAALGWLGWVVRQAISDV